MQVSSDLSAFVEIVVSNLKAKPGKICGKVNCYGVCPDCPKAAMVNKIIHRNLEEPAFKPLSEMDDYIDFEGEDAPESNDQVEIGSESVEDRIKRLRAFYAAQPFRVFTKEEQAEDDEDGINARGRFGRTKLHEAVYVGDKDRIMFLLEEGADVTITDNSGFTPYQFAVLEGRKDIVKLFRSKGIKN